MINKYNYTQTDILSAIFNLTCLIDIETIRPMPIKIQMAKNKPYPKTVHSIHLR